MGLAEPKRKVKYSIDPNALHWANNEDKFGKRLMEKMGWEKGKGLGAKEDGMTENIKVKFKQDTKGVGFNNNEYENVWLDHQDDFENLLSSLSQNNSTASKPEKTEEVKSLEQKSKESKRLHYKKFTRSKDLSSVTSSDLNCILGTQKRTKIKNVEETNNKSSNSENEDVESYRVSFKQETVQVNENSQESSEDKKDDSFGLKFNTNKMSLKDYFASKMASKMNLLKNKDEVKSEPIEIPVVIEPVETEEKPKKKKKKDKERELIEQESYTVSVKTEETIIPEETDETNEKRKKKKKKSKEEEIVEEQAEEEERPKKKKKKSKDKEEDVSLKQEENENKDDNDLDSMVKSSFKGSNLLNVYGYSAYYINSNLQEIIDEKEKRLNRKRYLVSKKLEIDADYYKMQKKMKI